MKKLYANERIVGEINEKGVDCYIVRTEVEDAPVAFDAYIPKSELVIDDSKIEKFDINYFSNQPVFEQGKVQSDIIHIEDAPVDMRVIKEDYEK